MLQNSTRLVLANAFGHHVEDVVHDSRAELEVKVRLDTLLRHCLCDSLGRAALKLTREEVAQPALEQGDNATEEEHPHPPARRPKTASGALPDRASVEAIVNDVLEILAHANLPHELVLVAVHARELAHVTENVLESVRQLEGVDVAQPILHVRVHNELGHPKNLSAEVKGVAETRLLTLLGRERLDGLEVEVVVEVEVVEVLAVDKQVEHVVALPAHLKSNLNPVQRRALKELCRLERPEEIPLLQCLGRAMMQRIKHKALQQLLVRHAHLDWLARRHVLAVPRLDEGHVECAARLSRSQVKRAR
eukprot:Opistho-2@25961